MKAQTRNIIILTAAALLLLPMGGSYSGILKSFIPAVEGFSPVPLWDYSQWSWGYGTAAGFDPNVKPQGTITREKAWTEAAKVINNHYNQLKGYVNKKLTGNQWAALLSFSYNCGPGAAVKIIETINTGTTAAVVARMAKYVYAGGVYNTGLVNRRRKETDLYQGLQSYGRGIDEEPQWIHGEITDYPY